MVKKTFNGITAECVKGDIAAQHDMQAIVNAANADLLPGGGVAGAIHRSAGPELEKECRPLAPIKPGHAVITGAHKLPNRYVIHCLGPVFAVDKPSDKLLASCYSEALKLAETKGIVSIAFPAISTGAFGYPAEEAARIALETAARCISPESSVQHIRFVLFSDSDLDIYERLLCQAESSKEP